MSETECRIGWYARDGYLDFFPLIARTLHRRYRKVFEYYACNYSPDESRLSGVYGIDNASVIAQYLGEHEWDITDEAIATLGRKFNSKSLVECLWPDRFEKDLTDATARRNLVGHFAFWEWFVRENGLDVLVSEYPSILSTCVAWMVCKKYGVMFLSFGLLPVTANRVGIIGSWNGHFDGLQEAIWGSTGEQDKEADRLAAEYVKTTTQGGVFQREKPLIDVDADKKEKMAFRNIDLTPRGLRAHAKRIKNQREYYVYRRSLMERVSRRVEVPFRRLLSKRKGLFERGPNPREDRYFLMPLHMVGEWANYAMLGVRVANQVELVREAAHCLPVGCVLYVKEHPLGFGYRADLFYRTIARTPRVKLIDPYEDVSELIKHCRAVVTLGSTLGFEAWLSGRPVICWNDMWYSSFPGVHRVDSPERLAWLMQNCDDLELAKPCEIQRCVRGVFAISFEADMAPVSRLVEEENVARFVSVIAARLSLVPRD